MDDAAADGDDSSCGAPRVKGSKYPPNAHTAVSTRRSAAFTSIDDGLGGLRDKQRDSEA
jgi:hypothetical protein